MEEFESHKPNYQTIDTKTEQTLRAELREQFLYLISNLTGRFCKHTLCNNMLMFSFGF